MFRKLKNILGRGDIEIPAPLAGTVVPLSEVNDPTFSQGILGTGCAIQPTNGKVVAPTDGIISLMFETAHAVSLETPDGIELLIHIGLDTVMLRGAHYTAHHTTGEKVKAGDVLIEFDLEAIRAAGYDPVTPVVACNADAFSEVCAQIGQTVRPLDTLFILKK